MIDNSPTNVVQSSQILCVCFCDVCEYATTLQSQLAVFYILTDTGYLQVGKLLQKLIISNDKDTLHAYC